MDAELIYFKKNKEVFVGEYIPSLRQWVAEQLELYEGSGGTAGLTLRDTGLPVIIVTKRLIPIFLAEPAE